MLNLIRLSIQPKNLVLMKKNLLLLFIAAYYFTGCAVKYGCPSTGRNIGAEKLLSGNPKVAKDVKKAGKFRGGKY